MKLKASLSIMIILSVFLTVGALNVASQGSTADPDVGETLSTASTQASLGTAITYQGNLKDNGNGANGKYDFKFSLFDAVSAGTMIGNTVTLNDVTVTDGIFTTFLDFGAGAFTDESRYLEIQVRPGTSTGTYEKLAPRQTITAAPTAHSLSSNHFYKRISIGAIDRGFENELFTVISPEVNPVSSPTYVGNANQDGIAIIPSDAKVTLHAYKSGDREGKFWYNYGANTWQFENNDVETVSINGSGLDVNGHINNSGNLNVGGGVRIGNPTRPEIFSAVSSEVNPTYSIGYFGNVNQDGLGILATNSSAGFATYKIASQEGSLLYNYATNTWQFENNDVETVSIDSSGTLSTKVLQIRGGADISEGFDINSGNKVEPKPGMVVCIDADHPGELIICEKAYDSTIAGAISGAGGVNPGMVMGQDGSIADGDYPVALTGRVYVWANATNGSIQPGDLLTTSNTPGYAMKATDHDQAFGTILGKAMTQLDSERGLVLVLVTLQ